MHNKFEKYFKEKQSIKSSTERNPNLNRSAKHADIEMLLIASLPPT